MGGASSGWRLARSLRCRGGSEGSRWLLSGVAVVGFGLVGGSALAQAPPTRQEVYMWGRYNSLPGTSRDLLRPTRIGWFDEHQYGWRKVAFGPNFGAALDREGRLFVWAEGHGGTSGIVPLLVELGADAKGQKLEDVQCAATSLYLMTKGGATFCVKDVVAKAAGAGEGSSLALNGEVVKELPQPGGWPFGSDSVKQMSIGLEHAAFLTRHGKVICVGGNEWGQCAVMPPKQKKVRGALENRVRVEVDKSVVQLPEGAGQVTQVAVGGKHTVVLDDKGRVYSWGDDRRVQLGLGDTRSNGADERHAYGVLTENHFGGPGTQKEMQRSVGYGYYQPHMQSSPLQTRAPEAKNRPEYPPPSLIACGEDFTTAVHRDSPDGYTGDLETSVVFVCGENSEGQSGRNFQQQQQIWLQARLPKRVRVRQLACGAGHCLTLLASGELYAWGANVAGQVGTGSRAPVAPPVMILLGEPVAEGEPPVQRQVLGVFCGFRNSAVICEVPCA